MIALVVLADGADVSSSAPPTALADHAPVRAARRSRSAAAHRSPYGTYLAGAACSRSSRRAGPSRPGRRRRPPAARRLEVRLRRLRRRRRRRCTCRRQPRDDDAPSRWPTRPAPSSRSPSTGSPTRRARRWCSRSSTSTAAAGCRSSSPTSTPTRSRIGARVEMTFRKLFTADGIHNYFWKARRPDAAMGIGRTGSRTASRSSGWAARASPSTGTRALDDLLLDATGRGVHVGRRHQGRRRRLLARHRAGRA